ncbi:molybdopterin oxidoreductase family protein [Actinocorallia longicatena]|uniref:Molybdopterin oxidoreductase family protein n=1 Tax=Actinocorallia longicatena TaxID=111803 RepID=A0ABP6QGI1_9ACTN
MTELKVLGACPLDCPDGCSWVVTVKDGVATSLRGNPEHPYTRGALCVKVNRWLEQAALPERILHPMRRVGAKGEGRFERITWDEALTEIAGRLKDMPGEAIWPYWGTGTLGYVQGAEGYAGQRLFNVLGASRHRFTICSIAGSEGIRYAIGSSAGIDPEDFALAKLVILWGTNPLTSGHHFWKFVQDARLNGAHVVAIDPVRSRTAAQADEHLAPLPGTDAALALGLLHVVLAEGGQDEEFLRERTVGWAEFRERIMEFPPSRAAEICGLDEQEIIGLGRRIARTRPTAIRATQGMQRHAGGGNALRTLACIPGVTGDWALPGGGLSYSTTGHVPVDVRALMRPDLRAGKRTRALSMTRVGEALLEADPKVEALFVIAANPAASVPDQNRVRRGLAREDLFTVVLEQFPTDTVDYADIVLPATMQHEHMDLNDGYGHLYIALNQPAVAPPGECLPTTETFRRLAAALGLTEPALFETDEQLVEQALAKTPGVTLELLRERGFARPDLPKPFLPYAEKFPTPSGKLEFRSSFAKANRQDPLAGYVPPAEVADEELAARFPFALISAASHQFLNTVFGSNPELRRRSGGPRVTIHPEDAARHGITGGARVRMSNDRGSFEAVAVVSDEVRPGVAACTKGHWAKLSGGANANALVAERDADIAGGAVYHDTRVSITPC